MYSLSDGRSAISNSEAIWLSLSLGTPYFNSGFMLWRHNLQASIVAPRSWVGLSPFVMACNEAKICWFVAPHITPTYCRTSGVNFWNWERLTIKTLVLRALTVNLRAKRTRSFRKSDDPALCSIAIRLWRTWGLRKYQKEYYQIIWIIGNGGGRNYHSFGKSSRAIFAYNRAIWTAFWNKNLLMKGNIYTAAIIRDYSPHQIIRKSSRECLLSLPLILKLYWKYQKT